MAEVVYVFDLDDTLYLERDYVKSGFEYVGTYAAAQFDVQGVAEYSWQLFESGVRGQTFDLVALEFGLPSNSARILVEEYRHHRPSIELLPDSRAFLDSLRDQAAHTGLITDGFGPGQRKKINALGLADYIDDLVVTGEFGPEWTKPSEKAFRLIESRWPPTATFIYFGDNPEKDFQAPSRLGWSVVRVRREGGLHFAVKGDDDLLLTVDSFTSWAEEHRARARIQ